MTMKGPSRLKQPQNPWGFQGKPKKTRSTELIASIRGIWEDGLGDQNGKQKKSRNKKTKKHNISGEEDGFGVCHICFLIFVWGEVSQCFFGFGVCQMFLCFCFCLCSKVFWFWGLPEKKNILLFCVFEKLLVWPSM